MEIFGASSTTEAGQSSSVSAGPSVSASQPEAQTVRAGLKKRPSGGLSTALAQQPRQGGLTAAKLARDAHKMRNATELLESWQLDPSEIVHGERLTREPQPELEPIPNPNPNPNPNPT